MQKQGRALVPFGSEPGVPVVAAAELALAAGALAENAKAPNTRRAYESDWASWEEFCQAHEFRSASRRSGAGHALPDAPHTEFGLKEKAPAAHGGAPSGGDRYNALRDGPDLRPPLSGAQAKPSTAFGVHSARARRVLWRSAPRTSSRFAGLSGGTSVHSVTRRSFFLALRAASGVRRLSG